MLSDIVVHMPVIFLHKSIKLFFQLLTVFKKFFKLLITFSNYAILSWVTLWIFGELKSFECIKNQLDMSYLIFIKILLVLLLYLLVFIKGIYICSQIDSQILISCECQTVKHAVDKFLVEPIGLWRYFLHRNCPTDTNLLHNWQNLK